METCRVLGINSSPIKGGNIECFLNYTLQEAEKITGVTTEAISLRGLEIGDCIQCNWCMGKQTADRPCVLKDDATPILKKIRDCDVLVLASPVYFLRMSGTMACLLDRSRCFIFGKEKHMALREKVGVALTVGWARNGGIETTLESLHWAFLVHEMRTFSVHNSASMLGVGAVSGPRIEQENKLKAMDDQYALNSASIVIKRAVEIAQKVSF